VFCPVSVRVSYVVPYRYVTVDSGESRSGCQVQYLPVTLAADLTSGSGFATDIEVIYRIRMCPTVSMGPSFLNILVKDASFVNTSAVCAILEGYYQTG